MGLTDHYASLLGVQPVGIGVAPTSLLLTLTRPGQLRPEIDHVITTDGPHSRLLSLLVVSGSVTLLLIPHKWRLLAICRHSLHNCSVDFNVF